MPINPTLIYGAGKAINQIGQFLGAKSAAERRQEQIDAEIKRRSATLGTKFIDVNRIQGAADRARIEEAGKVGRFEKALDADVGSFVGGALEKSIPERARTRADLILKDELGRTARDFQTEQDIARLKGIDVGKPSTGNLLTGLVGTGLETFAGIESQKQAEAKSLEAFERQQALAPKPVGAPGTQVFDTGYDRNIPLTGSGTARTPFAAQNAVEQSLSQPQQPQFKNFDDLLMFEVGRGTYTLEEALALKKGKPDKALPDFASKTFKGLSGTQQSYQKEYGKFFKDQPEQVAGADSATPFRPTTREDFTRITGKQEPDLKQIFDATMADEIDRKLGAGAADSVFNQIAPLLGLQTEQPTGDVSPLSTVGQAASQFGDVFGGSISEADNQAGQQFFGNDWGNLTPQEQQQIIAELRRQRKIR